MSINYDEYNQRLEAATAEAEDSSGKLRQIANGDENTEVLLDTGSCPTILRFLKDQEQVINIGATSILQQSTEQAELSEKWAISPEDVPVEGSEFSAYHWAKKAENFSVGILDVDGDTGPSVNLESKYYWSGNSPTVANVTDLQAELDTKTTEQYVADKIKSDLPTYTDIVYRASGGTSAIGNMIAGSPIAANVGDRCTTGDGEWVMISKSNPVALSDFSPAGGKCYLSDFISTGDEADNTAALLLADSVNKTIVVNGSFDIGNITTSRETKLEFTPGSTITYNGVLVINSLVISDHYPLKQGAGTAAISDYVIQVKPIGGDVSDPQDVNTLVPSTYWQPIKAQIHHGDYDTHLHIDNKWSGGIVTGVTGQRATLTVYGVDDDAGTISATTAENVKIKSAMFTSCGGGAFNPVLGFVELTDVNTYTDEKTQLEFYGCPNGADLGVRFRPVGGIEASGVFSYGSNISSENEDFGIDLLQYAYLTKHGGVISANGNTALNQGTSPKGKLILGLGTAVSGSIHISDSSGLNTDAYSRWNTSGAGNGFVYDQGEQSCYGIELLADSISAYHSYFTSLNDVQDASFSGGSVSLDEIGDGFKGIKIFSGSTSGAGTSQIRRINTISKQRINSRQALKAAVLIETLQANTAFEVGIGAKAAGQPFVYIEVTDSGVFGVYRDTTGTESKTILADSSFIPNRMLTYEIDIIPNRTGEGTQTALAIFRLTDTNDITRKVVSLDIDQDVTNNIIWSATSRTAGSNTMTAFLSELRVYRQS